MRTHPDDIQHETVGFTRIRAGAPAQHLLVQRRALCGPRAMMFQSTEGSSKPSVSTAQLATTRVAPVCNRWRMARRGGDRRRPIERFGGDAGRLKGLGHGIGQSDGRGKQQRLALRRMGLKGGEDLRRGVRREEEALQLGLDKIPLLRAQGIEIRLQQDLEGAQVDEMARLHHLQQRFLMHNAVERPAVGSGDPRSGVAVTPTTSGPSGCRARQ